MQPGDTPVFRKRKKKHQGETWTPKHKSADKPDGVWCGAHGLRHGYMSKELGFTTELYNGHNYIHWYCKKTGEVLDTVKLGGTSAEGKVPDVRLDDESELPSADDSHDQP